MKEIHLSKKILLPNDLRSLFSEVVDFSPKMGKFVIGIGSLRFRHIERFLYEVTIKGSYTVICYNYDGTVCKIRTSPDYYLDVDGPTFGEIYKQYWNKELLIIIRIDDENYSDSKSRESYSNP